MNGDHVPQRLPLVLPHGPKELYERAVDPDIILSWLQRELPALASCPIQVISCRGKVVKTPSSARRKYLRVLYAVNLRGPGGEEWQRRVICTFPSDPGFLSPELLALCAEARDHPAARPFHHLAAYVEGLSMGLVILPLDPALPGLARMTGFNGPGLLAPFLPECRRGATIIGSDWTLRHYKPGLRCVLRFDVSLGGADGTSSRAVYAKIFCDDRGRALHAEMDSLWQAARGSEYLRMPEPLGYDPNLRMVVMSDVGGERPLCDWIKCLEKGRPLPPADETRLERCMAVAAQALWELQRTGVRPAPRRTFAAEIAGFRDRLGTLRPAQPALVGELEALLSRLEARGFRDAKLVPAHGGFRHKQVIGGDGGLTIVDWDGLCLAHPALDAATFLARLRQDPIEIPGAAPGLERLAELFRREFLGRASDVSRSDLALYEALVLAHRALRAFRRPAEGEKTANRLRNVMAAAHELLDVHTAPGNR